MKDSTLSDKWRYLKSHAGFRRAPGLVIARTCLWRIRCIIEATSVVPLARWGVRLAVPAQWRGISRLIYTFREEYEPELAYLGRVLKPGHVVVDAGACFGIYSTVAGRLVGSEGRVLAFEPAAASFELLRRNIALNRLGNVRAVRCALSDRRGAVRLFHYRDPGRNSFGVEAGSVQPCEHVPTETLDEAIEREGVRKVDFIKIDVEGAEALVLKGGEGVLRRDRPTVVFEVNAEATKQLDLAENGAWDILARLGYDFFGADSAGRLSKTASPPPGGNVVAVVEGGHAQA
jgi:FkbM family methyltransferase